MRGDPGRRAALAGARDMAPIIIGMTPFALVAGLAAVAAGQPAWAASVSSVVVFAGAAQIVLWDLVARQAPVLVMVLTAVVVNARFVMYSASLAPRFARVRLPQRAAAAYLLTDQAFAVTTVRLQAEPEHPARFAYYLGGALPLWVAWQVFTAVGALVGSAVPTSYAEPLAFAVPLVFASLLVPAVTDRPTLVAAVVSAAVATLAAPLPANLGLLVASAAGITAGVVVSRRRRRRGGSG